MTREQDIAAAEHERDLKRESFTRYDVRCMDCGVKVRTSQWPGMVAVCRRCAAIKEPVTTFSGHGSYTP